MTVEGVNLKVVKQLFFVGKEAAVVVIGMEEGGVEVNMHRLGGMPCERLGESEAVGGSGKGVEVTDGIDSSPERKRQAIAVMELEAQAV